MKHNTLDKYPLFFNHYILDNYSDILHGDTVKGLEFTRNSTRTEPEVNFTDYSDGLKINIALLSSNEFSNIHGYLPDLHSTFMDKYYAFYRNTKKRFTYYPANIRNFDSIPDGHVMFYLYDKQQNEVEFYNNKTLDFVDDNQEYVINFFRKIYGKKVKFTNVKASCLKFKSNKILCKLFGDLSESTQCVLRGLLYLDMLFKNKKGTSKEIDKIFLTEHINVCKILVEYDIYINKILGEITLTRNLSHGNTIKISKKDLPGSMNISHLDVRTSRLFDKIKFIKNIKFNKDTSKLNRQDKMILKILQKNGK